MTEDTLFKDIIGMSNQFRTQRDFELEQILLSLLARIQELEKGFKP